MTAADIQRRLIHDRFGRNFVMKNYTPAKWFECDVFELTKAGYFIEYEIKLSRSDFKADALKAREKITIGSEGWKREKMPSKHDQLREGVPHGPTRFNFVVCESTGINELDVPDWAGLIIATPRDSTHRILKCDFNTVRPAPKLHNVKADEAIKRHAESTCYWRMTRLFLYGRDVEPIKA